MACASCQRPIHVIPGRNSSAPYCMLPAAQRRSRARNSGSAGGLPSREPASSGRQHTFQPAACSRTASTWSWLRMGLPSGSGARRQCSRKGAMRTIALCPQYGPSGPCHHAWPVAQLRIPARIPNWNRRGKAAVAGRPTMSCCTMARRASASMQATRRSTASADISLSASRQSISSCPSAWWSRKSITLPALKPVFVGAPPIADALRGARPRRAERRHAPSSSPAASAGSVVSDRSHRVKRSAAPRAASPSSRRPSGGSTSSIRSFLMQTAIAVERRGTPPPSRARAAAPAARRRPGRASPSARRSPGSRWRRRARSRARCRRSRRRPPPPTPSIRPAP